MFKFWLEGLILWKAFSIEMMGKKYFWAIISDFQPILVIGA